MLKIDMKGVKALEDKLYRLNKRGIPFANREALNGMAFKSQQWARGKVATSMINKNKFTMQSIQVHKAKGLRIATQESAVGSTQKYMETQEFGGINKPGPKAKNIVLNTSESAGQKGVKPRTKLPTKRNKIRNIRLRKGKSGGKSKAQINLLKVKMAAKAGHKTVYLEDTKKDKDGIYRLNGGKKNPKVRLMHDLSRKSAYIPKNPWLMPSVDKVRPLAPKIYAKALYYQIRRLK